MSMFEDDTPATKLPGICVYYVCYNHVGINFEDNNMLSSSWYVYCLQFGQAKVQQEQQLHQQVKHEVFWFC